MVKSLVSTYPKLQAAMEAGAFIAAIARRQLSGVFPYQSRYQGAPRPGWGQFDPQIGARTPLRSKSGFTTTEGFLLCFSMKPRFT